MTEDQTEADTENRWEGDLLMRQSTSAFLQNLIVEKAKLPRYAEKEALCFAIDADWGAGKSFFVRRWAQDLQDAQHLVVEFDAWANDLSEDPLIGFMAELRDGLAKWQKLLPTSQVAPAQVTKIMKGFRRAFFPTAGVLLKGYLANKVGKDTIEQVWGGDFTDLDMPDKEELGEGLDKFLEKALDEHSDIKDAIAELKSSIQGLLKYLEQQQKIRLPMVVIVDELDRCRPNYAIRLLEGIKHLFGAPNVCFVVSTNIGQMAEAVRAVYGPGFDGYQYLKRFFAFEYNLPSADKLTYCKTLVLESSFDKAHVNSGLPDQYANSVEAVAACLNVVAEAFSLTPRSIRQVMFVCDAAALTLKKYGTVHVLYLLFLAAARLKEPQLFNKVTSKSSGGNEWFKHCLDAGFKDQRMNFYSRRGDPVEAWLSTTISIYLESAHMDVRQLRDAYDAIADDYAYPQSLRADLFQACTQASPQQGKKSKQLLTLYPEALLTAGQLNVS